MDFTKVSGEELWAAIEKRAREMGTFCEQEVDAPEGSAFTGCDCGWGRFAALGCSAVREWIGISGTGKYILGHGLKWVKAPGTRTWEGPIEWKVSGKPAMKRVR